MSQREARHASFSHFQLRPCLRTPPFPAVSQVGLGSGTASGLGIGISKMPFVSGSAALGSVDARGLLDSLSQSGLRVALMSVYDINVIREVVCRSYL